MKLWPKHSRHTEKVIRCCLWGYMTLWCPLSSATVEAEPSHSIIFYCSCFLHVLSVTRWTFLTVILSNWTDLSPPGWQRSPDCPFVCWCSTCICPCLALSPSWGAGRHCLEGYESWTSKSFHWSACSGVQTDPCCNSSCEPGFVACTSGSPQSQWVWSYRAGCSHQGWHRWCWNLVER